MLKTGLILQVNDNSVHIVTSEYDFYELAKKEKTSPKVGDIYTSEIYKRKNKYLRYVISIIIILALAFLTFFFIKRNTVSYTALVTGNTSIELKLNKSNKVVNVRPLSDKALAITNNLNLEGKSFNKAVSLIIKQEKKQNPSNNDYSIYISSHKNASIDFSSFKNVAQNNNVNIAINDYGEEHLIKVK